MAEHLGWTFSRASGSHFVYEKAGTPLNLSIPNHRTIGRGLLAQLVKTMGVTPDEFIRMVKK